MCSLRSRVSDWIKYIMEFRSEKRFVVFFTSEKKRIKAQKIIMGKKKQISGAAKRKKKKEKEQAVADELAKIEEAAADMERLKLGPTKLWTGLVLHHKDIFVSHVLPKLNTTDRFFFSKANTESLDLLEYAGVNVSQEGWYVHECSSISTLEFVWNKMNWVGKFDDGRVKDQAWFCNEVAATNKLEFLKWAREVKHCEWGENTINEASFEGTLAMLKYCFANGCPYDETTACPVAAGIGHLDCLRFLFDKMKPSRETEKKAAETAVHNGQMDILKYMVEERKISDAIKTECMLHSVPKGHLDCLKYLVEEAKAPLDDWRLIAVARYQEKTECLHYLREKGCPEPTDEQYALHVRSIKEAQSSRR
jgi:hypothetical protein